MMEECSLDQFPDDVLCCIISWLSLDEAMRTSILSKRWKLLWKNVSILDFDVTHMIKPLSNLKNKNKPMRFDLKNAENHAHKYREIVNSTILNHLTKLTSCRFNHFPSSFADADDVDDLLDADDVEDLVDVDDVEDLVDADDMVDVEDVDDLVDADDVEDLVKLVLEKNKQLSSLILECCSRYVREVTHFQRGIFSNLCSLELTNYRFESTVSSAFECCEKLKTLKLKKIRMENGTVDDILKNCLALEKFSLIEPRGFEKLKIQNSNLRVLELGWLIVREIDVYVENLQILTLDSLTCSIKRFKIYSQDLRVFSSCRRLAKQIPAKYIDQRILQTKDILERCSDLLESQPTNIYRNLLSLSIELDLNNIRESLALAYILKSCNNLNTLEITIPVRGASYSCRKSDDGVLPFPKSMFWNRQQIYDCINRKLKFATVRGFTGKEQEMNFVKHLITRANMVEKIYVICDSSIMEEPKSLLSLKRASVYLSIILKSI